MAASLACPNLPHSWPPPMPPHSFLNAAVASVPHQQLAFASLGQQAGLEPEVLRERAAPVSRVEGGSCPCSVAVPRAGQERRLPWEPPSGPPATGGS